MPIMPRQKRNIGWFIVAIAALFLFSMAGKVVNLATDFFWFKELRLTTVFLTSFSTKIFCSIGVGILAFLAIYLNILIATRVANKSSGFASFLNMAYAEIAKLLPALKWLFPLVALFFAFVFGSWGASLWDIFLKFKASVPFNVADPLFHKDIGFYVFQLPFYRALFQGFISVTVISLLAAGFIYVIRQCVGFDGKQVMVVHAARTHLLILLGLACLSLVAYFQLKLFGMVNAGSSIVNGAGYADIKVYIPMLKIMEVVAGAGAILIWANIWSRSWKPVIAAAIIVIVGAIGGKLASQLVQKFIVAPNEVVKETPYIKWSIANTRAGYNLETIEERHFMPTEDLTADQLAKNVLTTKNIRLWDQAPLLTTYSQLQEIRTYYEFLDVDNDRYMIDGELRQVMFSPRELIPANLQSRNWINEHLTYTHGYGLCLGPVNSVTQEGLPDFFIKNIPPVSTSGVSVSRPEIYFGEAPTTYSIVKTDFKEFDYPTGEDNAYTTYNGTGGIPMGSLFKKLLFAMRLKELKIILTGSIKPSSRILLNQNIMTRVNTALPFLAFDSDPYLAISNEGRLFWMVDGYTTTSAYPYSAEVKGIGNYIRNSVKITIDAYNGTLSAYVYDNTDPLIKCYSKIFPGVFKPFSEMPADLRKHIRYPQTLFTVQARVYAIYHMTDPQVFYNKEDIWKIPESFTEGQSGPMVPYYTIMKLAEVGQQEEFILMVPFSPAKKENMIAWLAARCDEPNYGKLLVFNFPKQKLVYGPSQIESRINQDPEISKQLTLWNQGGSRVIRGSLLVIPIEQSLIFVQPLYIAAQSGGVPELKRVIVAYGNSIAMEETLEKSLNLIFGGSSGQQVASPSAPVASVAPQTTEKSTDIKSLITDANHQYERAQNELEKGNWAGYGAAMSEVKRLLGELGKIAEKK